MNFAKLLFKGLNNYEKFQPFSKLGLQGLHLIHDSMQVYMPMCMCACVGLCACVHVCVRVRERERDSYCFIKQLKDKDWHIMKY